MSYTNGTVRTVSGGPVVPSSAVTERRRVLQVIPIPDYCLPLAAMGLVKEVHISITSCLTHFLVQARLKRIEDRLACIRAPPSAVPVTLPPPPPPAFHKMEPVANYPADYSAAGPPKRKASELSTKAPGQRKRHKPGGSGGLGRLRLLPLGRYGQWYDRCALLIDQIMLDPSAVHYFNNPVDAVALGALLLLPPPTPPRLSDAQRLRSAGGPLLGSSPLPSAPHPF
jgi:hypothetical protein